jgi:thioredoxin 1
MGNVPEIKDDNFKDEILSNKLPAIVDFWAEWCVPCKIVAPVVDEVAKEMAGKVKFGKINVDENTEVATDLAVMNIPTLIFFKNGKEIDRVVGVVTKRDLVKRIKESFGV